MNAFEWYWLWAIVFLILYGALILWFKKGWEKIAEFSPTKSIFNSKITVIVPFRNENKNLERCLKSILRQQIQTSEIEILAINDHSTDNSVTIAEKLAKQNFKLTVMHSDERGKKNALLYGINAAKGDIIVTTDADCTHNENWLTHIAAYFEEYSPKLLVGGVKFRESKKLFQQFQQLELLSYVISGAGAIGINHAIMCNGANLAFSKSAFNELDDPYNIKYLSGDDVFLLHAMKKKYDNDIHFLKSKDSIVETKSCSSIRKYFKQKKRWASKAKGYNDKDTKFTGAVVLAINTLLIGGLLGIPFYTDLYKPTLLIWVVKTTIDWWFLYKTTNLFNSFPQKIIPYFEFIHAYSVSYSAIVGFFAKSRW